MLSSEDEELFAKHSTPSQVAIVQEEWVRMLEGLPAHQQDILDMIRQGNSPDEVSQELGVSDRAVRRAVRKVEERIES